MIYLFLILWFGFVLTMITASLIVVPRQGKARICTYLEARGVRNITVEYRWFSNDRYYSPYAVTYQDATGVFHSTTCVTPCAFWGDKPIYWLDSPRGIANPLLEENK